MTIVIVALALVVLLVFVAFAVDIGGAYNQQRQTQSAVDTGDLAAGQELDPNFPHPTCPNGDTVQQCAALDIRTFVNSTLKTSYGDPTVVGGDWDQCGSTTIPTSFAGITGVTWKRYPFLSTGSPSPNGCIAFSTDGLYLWSEVPPNATSSYKTSFANVIGINSINVFAGATVGLRPQGVGGVLPFGLNSTTPGQDCLKTGPAGSKTNCSGQINGNFGYLQFAQYGSARIPTPTQCSISGKSGSRWPSNVAIGVDHTLSTWQLGGPDRLEAGTSPPPTCTVIQPNETSTETGTDSGPLDAGLLTGSAGGTCNTCIDDGGLPRLARTFDGSGNYYNRLVNINDGGTHKANDTGLWEFIPNSLDTANTPVTCRRETMDDQAALGVANVLVQLQTCFTDYKNGVADSTVSPQVLCTTKPCNGQVFNNAINTSTSNPHLLDLQLNSRFGYVPILDGSSGLVHFITFRAVYLEQLGMDQGSNTVTWDPDKFQPGGEGDPAVTGSPIRSVSAWLFDPNMLSPCPDPSAATCLASHPLQSTAHPVIQLMH
jgi:hypothetical protein